MKVISLQSGSNGNSIYVEAGGVRLLFDAGISGSRAKERLAAHGRNIADVDAVLISHDHADHSRCMGIYHRKFGLPIYATTKTFQVVSQYRIGEIDDLRHFVAGDTLSFERVTVETIPTPHDGVDGVAFVVDDGKHRLGILTDLGHVFSDLPAVVGSLDAVLLESNYDPEMLANGPYPAFLKARILGPGGHLSNLEAAEMLHANRSKRMQWVCLAHLSGDNNTPAVALATHRRLLGDHFHIRAASRERVSEVMEI